MSECPCACDKHVTENEDLLQARTPEHTQRTVMVKPTGQGRRQRPLFLLFPSPLGGLGKAMGPMARKSQTKPTLSPDPR